MTNRCRVCKKNIVKGSGMFYKGMHIHKACKTTAEIYWWRYKRPISKATDHILKPVTSEFNEFLNYLIEKNLLFIRNNSRVRKQLNMNINEITKFLQALEGLKILTLYNKNHSSLYKINRDKLIKLIKEKEEKYGI